MSFLKSPGFSATSNQVAGNLVFMEQSLPAAIVTTTSRVPRLITVDQCIGYFSSTEE
jgi:hypothetical protein